MRIAAGSKLLFIGDSVTDTGRAQPVGEGRDALGNGYVRNIDALLQSAYPAHPVRVVNVGTSGNTVRNLQERWQRDVLDLRPNWVSVMIGINDVWRQFDSPHQSERGVPLHEYETTLRDLLRQTQPAVSGLVLMTPYFIETNPSDAMRAQMDRYGAAVRALSEEFDTVFVDTQAAFNTHLAHYHSAAVAWDRVHPNAVGHMILARAWLQAVGFSWTGEGA